MQEAFFLSRRSMRNESRLKQSGICGCYHCGSIFEVSEIQEWADDGGEDKTAICPKCGIDSVLDKDAVSPFTSAVLKHFSSMGGYVSMVVANEQPVAGLFLMAPALWMSSEEYSVQSYQPQCDCVEITHGVNDEIVPVDNSIRFVKEHKGTILHLVPDDHRLKESHNFLACQFKRFLESLL